MSEETEISAAIAAGAAITEHSIINEVPVFVIPEGYKIETKEHILDQPIRVRRKPLFQEVESFCRYAASSKADWIGVPRVFAKMENNEFYCQAILDYDAWNDHIATLNPPRSLESKTWLAGNKKHSDQRTLAEFIEENVSDILEPLGGSLLELVGRLTAKTTVNFVSGVRLDNGNEQLSYEESTTANAGAKGNMEVPTLWKVALPVFQNGPRYEIQVRLRYRITERKLTLWYEMLNWHLAVKAATDELLAVIEKATGIKPFMGWV